MTNLNKKKILTEPFWLCCIGRDQPLWLVKQQKYVRVEFPYTNGRIGLRFEDGHIESWITDAAGCGNDRSQLFEFVEDPLKNTEDCWHHLRQDGQKDPNNLLRLMEEVMYHVINLNDRIIKLEETMIMSKLPEPWNLEVEFAKNT